MNFKNKILIICSAIIVLGLIDNFRGSIDNIVDNNGWYDYTNEYIVKPEFALYKNFEWATWMDSVPGRMAHDPKWFKLPDQKYISKEIPFDWSKFKYSTAIEKTGAYYDHLCKTEGVAYMTEDYPQDVIKSFAQFTSSWLYMRTIESPVKNINEILKNTEDISNNKTMNMKDRFRNIHNMYNVQTQNPFVNPLFIYNKKLKAGANLDFYFSETNDHYYKNQAKYSKIEKDTFREYMDENGKIYQIKFDSIAQKYLPVQIIPQSQARYYSTYRETQKPEMRKLGIWEFEHIILDTKTNELVAYHKNFIRTYYDVHEFNHVETPININRNSSCQFQTKKIKSLSK